MSRRFFDPQPFAVGSPTDLGDNASHHISRVLRMRVDEELELFNGEGGEYRARIVAISKRAVTVLPLAHTRDDRCAPRNVTVALPMIKGERMDYAIQKATELGAGAFQLVHCERSDVRLNGEREEKKREHLRQVAISACEQCGMNRVPAILPVMPVGEYFRQASQGMKLLAHPGETAADFGAIVAAPDLCLVTGPEGGFSNEEIAQAQAAGFVPFALGARVLRAETAPVALLAALWAHC